MKDGRLWALLLAWLLVGCHAAPAHDASTQENAIDWGHFDPEAEQAKADARAKVEAEEEARRQRALPQPPRTTPIVRGQKPPPGYTEVKRPDWILFWTGVGLIGLSYVLPAAAVHSTVQNNEDSNAWTMQVPVIGPILQIGYTVDHYSKIGGPGFGLMGYVAVGYYFVALAALSGIQLGGFVLPVLAFTEKQPVWVRSDLALLKAPRVSSRLRFTGSALEVVGRF
jgi:hypothetical protein